MRTTQTFPGVRDKKNVVFLMQDLKLGGTQRQALELARRMNRDVFNVSLWVLAGGDHYRDMAYAADVPVLHLGGKDAVTPGSLFKLFCKLNSSIDILVTLTVVPNIWGRVFGALRRVPLRVGNIRGPGLPSRQHEGMLWRLAHHHISNTMAQKRIMLEKYGVPDARVSVIYNGLDVEHFTPPVSAAPAARQCVVLCAARLVADKGHAYLLDAWNLLQQKGPNARLDIMGEGPLRGELRERIEKMGLSGSVRLLPAVADPAPVYQQADVLVLPSIGEGLPNVILEAMASGLPVVATDVGGCAEAVRHEQTGFMVPPADPAALAGALSPLLENRALRAAMGQAGLKRARACFAMQTMVSAHEKLFLRLLAEA